MSEKPSDVFNVDKIRELVELMKEHDLNEVDLHDSPQRIRLRRGPKEGAMVQMQPMAPAAPAAAPQAAPTDSGAPAADEGNFITIDSPTVGTFYNKPKPGEPEFVKVGDTVSPETIVCLVEAMKMFNEIPAGVSGKIVEVLVKNEEPVDVNRPLFKVAPN